MKIKPLTKREFTRYYSEQCGYRTGEDLARYNPAKFEELFAAAALDFAAQMAAIGGVYAIAIEWQRIERKYSYLGDIL